MTTDITSTMIIYEPDDDQILWDQEPCTGILVFLPSGECCSVDVSTSGTVVGPIQTVEDDGPGRDVAAHLMTPVVEAALAAYRVRTTGEELS